MGTSAAWSLQQAIIACLKTNQTLRQLAGGDHIYDAVPARAAYPFVTFGPLTLRDNSTGDSIGHDHIFTLTAYSRSPGFREVYALADAITRALIGAQLQLTGHRLVLLRFETAEFRRETDTQTSRAAIIFRAISEPII